MKKFNLLLLDANVIIYLFEMGLWDQIVDRCDVQLAQSVIQEASFWQDDAGCCHKIDLTEYINSTKVNVVGISLSDLKAFHDLFDGIYRERLDLGEAESLAYLHKSNNEDLFISSGDSIVYKVLGNLDKSEQGISLEEVLERLGMGRTLPWQYCKKFREQWTQKGFEEGLHGIGSKIRN